MAPSAEWDSPSLTKEKTDVAIVHIEDDTDGVLDFGGDSELPPPPKLTPEQEKALYRKVDIRLMPILASMYLLSFLDRG